MTTVLERPRAKAETRSKSLRRYGERPSIAYLFLSPWVVGAVFLTAGPMVWLLYLSFTDYDLFTAPQWVGVDNYVRMLTVDPHFWNAVWATTKFVVISVPAQLIAALGVAMLINRRSRAQGFYRSAFYAPSLLGASVSVALVWRVIFHDWIGHPDRALLALVLLAVWQFGAPMVIFLAGLQQIPQEYYDAAAVDGAGPWRTFLKITVPMLSPVIFFNLVLDTIRAFQVFTGAYVVSNGTGGPSDSTLFYTLYLYEKGFVEFKMGYASAMSWFLLLIIALITALLFRTAKGWVFYSGDET
ncbi:multiple sugar transport system permease protein [Actinoplanes campanulatus]|uniref:Multiple sugar transport system permease protein n=1 Tax=Actinoplanes campanulatus TaxID=113559 RepID=A0A7W5AGF9_9ACTN|nr:sugar ABC transporter permease [Actinoplanes campanulatus]MBB3095610.1 multiple sugar transport system permease protein [Actinoplanes campanulatus]GGN10248.1 sugar ABC transporter permease [Actinoplanes campanulatus]GID36504.1 sugar ABC transporter permease [Actinoplanes campanulatus]